MQESMETKVKSYKNAHEFQKDQAKMAKQGWSVVTTTSHQQERGIVGKLLVPGGMFTKGKSELVITYQRPVQIAPQKPQKLQVPKGLSFKEKGQWYKDQRQNSK